MRKRNRFISKMRFRYLDEYDHILNLPEIKEKMSRFKDIIDKLSKLSGRNIEKPLDLHFLYHTFLAESSMNLTLPEWVHDYFPDGPLFDTIVFAYNINGFTPLIRKLLAGKICLENFIFIIIFIDTFYDIYL